MTNENNDRINIINCEKSFTIDKKVKVAPASWKLHDPTMKVMVWTLHAGGMNFEELESFSASTDMLMLWELVYKLGYVPIATISRVEKHVIWMISLRMFRPEYVAEQKGIMLLFDGDTYNSKVESGDYLDLPIISQSELRWWIGTLEVKRSDVFYQQSIYTTKSVSVFMSKITSWYTTQIAKDSLVLYGDFEPHDCFSSDAGNIIEMENSNGTVVVKVSDNRKGVQFVENPPFPFMLSSPMLIEAIECLEVE